MDFTVSLEETYRGPIDLLVQLVRDEEVDVRDVALARVCADLLRVLERAGPESLDEGGELLVFAATLLSLKSRTLLPSEEVDLAEEDLVPDEGLVESLLEYRRFRDAARALGRRAEARAARWPRGSVESFEDDGEIDLGEVNAYDVAAVFGRLLRQTLLDRPHRVASPMRALKAYARDLLDRIASRGKAPFLDLFEGARDRGTIVGLFAALLELVKQGIVRARQGEPFGEIEVVLALPPEAALARFAEAFPGEERAEEAGSAPPAPSP